MEPAAFVGCVRGVMSRADAVSGAGAERKHSQRRQSTARPDALPASAKRPRKPEEERNRQPSTTVGKVLPFLLRGAQSSPNHSVK